MGSEMCIRDRRRTDPRLLKADAASKGVDTDTWELPNDVFCLLEKWFGVFSIDLFADFSNTKKERFYSKFWHKSSLGVDALVYSWEGEHALLVPPVSIALKAFKKAIQTKMTGVRVVPLWEGGKFWPLIMPDGSHAVRGVTQIRVFSTKMQKSSCSSSKSIMTDVYQRYLAVSFKGGEHSGWIPQVARKFCVRTLLGGACKLCSNT